MPLQLLYRPVLLTAGLVESNGSLLPGLWRDSLHVTCGCTPGSAPGPTLGNEYGKTLPFFTALGPTAYPCSYTGFAIPTSTSSLYSFHARRNNNSVELLRYCRRRSTYLLADWSCYATDFSPSSNHRPPGNTTRLATRLFTDKMPLLMTVVLIHRHIGATGLSASTPAFYLYDTRCYFNVRSKADISQLNLPHGTNN